MAGRFTGLIAATFTPLGDDGLLRPDTVGPVVEHLVRGGVAGLYVAGSTGEGMSLTGDERRRVAEAYIEAAAGRLPVIVQVGHNSLAEARDLARHAQQIGAAAVSAVPPSYFRPADTATLADCLAEIAAGAPNLPFYYYHIPSLTGVAADLVELLRIAAERVPTLAGLKFTSPALHELHALLALDGGRWDVLHGLDEMLLSGLAVGVRGAVGSTYNVAAPLYRRLMAAFDAGQLDEARRLQGLSVAMVRIFQKHGGLPAIKATMRLLDLDCGPPRLPLRPLMPHPLDDLRCDLDALGFFEWAC